MYLHLGGETVVSSEEIIGVFDINLAKNPSTRDFLQKMQSQNRHVTVISGHEIKAFVVTIDKIYLSPIAGSTLRRRSNYRLKTNPCEP